MFSNIGRKIVITAKVLCWIGIICSVIGGIVLIILGAEQIRFGARAALPMILGGIGTALLGSLVSWVASFPMVGFGVLVEKAEEIAANTEKNGY